VTIKIKIIGIKTEKYAHSAKPFEKKYNGLYVTHMPIHMPIVDIDITNNVYKSWMFDEGVFIFLMYKMRPCFIFSAFQKHFQNEQVETIYRHLRIHLHV
jgi:hypothetical protein